MLINQRQIGRGRSDEYAVGVGLESDDARRE